MERLTHGGEHHDNIGPEYREEDRPGFYREPGEDYGGVDDDTIAEGEQDWYDRMAHLMDHAGNDYNIGPEYREDGRPEFYREPDEDYGGVDDDTIAEGEQDSYDQIDHLMDHAVDDEILREFDEQFGWRAKARRKRKGWFVPPDMRTYRWPTFVRVADLEK